MNMTKTSPKQHLKKMAGGSANINSLAINKHCAYSQFRVPNPPLLLAAKRCAQVGELLD